jgi:arsenite methyltransferase
MTDQIQFSDDTARALDTVYLSPLATARRQRALALLGLQTGERVLDIGTGPGFLVTDVAAAVGPSGTVVGVDRSPDLLAVAQRRCGTLSQVSLHEADATAMLLDSGTFDAATVVQVYEYVPDVAAALRELHRVLRPGGRAVIVDTDWSSLVWEATDRARANRIFNAWEEHLADPFLPRRLPALLRQAGFEVAEVQPHTMFSATPEPFSAGLAKLVAGFVPGRRGVTAEDAAAWLADVTATNDYFFSLTAFQFLARR